MRALAAVALGALALIAAGCGGTSTAGLAQGATLDGNAANLVPANASAFVSVDTDLSSTEWQRVDALTKSFPARAQFLERFDQELSAKGLSWKGDVAPALGPETDVAILGAAPIVFTHPSDDAKLKALVAKLSTGRERYTVDDVGGWSVVTDSNAALAAVRSAQNGQSLADTTTFKDAWSSTDGDALARAYVKARALTPTGIDNANWIAARVSADADALRVDAVVQPRQTLPPLAPTSLLGDVPSGAALAVSFRETGDLLQKLAPTHLPKTVPLKELAPLLSGGGVAYVRANGLIPEFALELAPKDPQAALAAARTLLRAVAAKLGTLQLTAQLANGRLVVANSPAAIAALHDGSKLVDDAAYKGAVAKAGVPSQTSFVAYADVAELAPFIPVVVQAVTGKPADPALAANLAHVGTVLAWGTRDGGRAQLHAWIQTR